MAGNAAAPAENNDTVHTAYTAADWGGGEGDLETKKKKKERKKKRETVAILFKVLPSGYVSIP